ncbi:MAG: tetratricopeptide repeat protein [Bacteroidota bacterium]
MENPQNQHVHHHHQANNPAPKKSGLDTLERLSKIISIVAIPVLVAVYGNILKEKLSNQSLQKDYVDLAVDILTKEEIDPPIRDWAVDLLNDNAPTKMSEEAIAALKSGEAKLPNIRSALTAFEAENYFEAGQEYDALIQANENDPAKPESPELYSRRGYSNYKLKRYERALQDFDKAISLDPDRYADYFFKSLVYSAMKKYEMSNQMLAKTLELAPRHKAARNNRGMNYINLGMPDLACEDFRQAAATGNQSAKKNLERYCQ